MFSFFIKSGDTDWTKELIPSVTQHRYFESHECHFEVCAYLPEGLIDFYLPVSPGK
ncbi:MAG: hypothetical protein JRD05_00495 [Deltaproteobacteria bacterium]|nr:hypothetical protein [Deltaproteobacteria bacterium]